MKRREWFGLFFDRGEPAHSRSSACKYLFLIHFFPWTADYWINLVYGAASLDKRHSSNVNAKATTSDRPTLFSAPKRSGQKLKRFLTPLNARITINYGR